MKKLLIMVMFLSSLVLPQPAKAGGIPVFDGVGLAQGIQSYVQNLRDYVEQLKQYNMLDSQYSMQLQQYQRELEEYSHYLQNIQSMGTVLNAADWDKVLQQTVSYYGNSPWASLPNVNVVTTEGATNIKTVIETAYEVPDSAAVATAYWQTQIPGYGMTPREAQEQDVNNIHMQRFVDRQMVVAQNQTNINQRSTSVSDFYDKARTLPDDSELQTQQLIAQELAFMLQQQEILSTQLNQLIGSQETQSEFVASQDARAKERARAVQQKHQSNTLPTTLGTSAWKSL